MSQILSADEILELKQVILEELELANGQGPSDEVQRLLAGFAAKRGDLSFFEERLIRRIITGTENGKLPSEELREQIIRNNFLAKNIGLAQEIERNSKGAILFNRNTPSAILLTVPTATPRYKKSKIRYAFDVTFTEFVITVNNLDELIDQLKDQIESLKNKVSILENEKANIRTTLISVEIDNQSLRNNIQELSDSLTQLSTDLEDIEVEKRDEIIRIQEEAQQLVIDANNKLIEKESEYAEFRSKVEVIFVVSKTYDEIVDNFKKIGIGV